MELTDLYLFANGPVIVDYIGNSHMEITRKDLTPFSKTGTAI